MVYFMKKLVVVGLMSAGLVACGGGGESSSGSNTDPTQLNTPTANILTVKGTGVNKQEAITVSDKTLLVE
jgi:ABC-type glycerol-3-phosphate transport system substrate-binding protein